MNIVVLKTYREKIKPMIYQKNLNYKIENQISADDALKFSYSNSDYCVVAFSKKDQIKLLNL